MLLMLLISRERIVRHPGGVKLFKYEGSSGFDYPNLESKKALLCVCMRERAPAAHTLGKTSLIC